MMGRSLLILAFLLGTASVALGGTGWQALCGGIFSPRRCRQAQPLNPIPDAIIIPPEEIYQNPSGWGPPPEFRTTTTPRPLKTPGWGPPPQIRTPPPIRKPWNPPVLRIPLEPKPTSPPPPPPPNNHGWGPPPPPPPPPEPNVDLPSFVETCSANFITQDYKDGWEGLAEGYNSNFKWNIRLASKLHVYLMAYNLLQTNGFRQFNEKHYLQSCFQVDRLNEWVITNTTGFGRSINLRMEKTSNRNVYRLTFAYGPAGASGGTASVILSDNHSYTAFEFCLDNGLRTFAVFTTKDFQDRSLEAILVHLRSLGFKPKNIVDLNPRQECFLYGGELIPRGRNGADITSPIPGPPKNSDVALIKGVLPSAPYFFKKK